MNLLTLTRRYHMKPVPPGWGFAWDDPDKAAKEVREEQYGSDHDTPGDEQFCYKCGEVGDTEQYQRFKYCPFCGYVYGDAKEMRKLLASYIDIAYTHLNTEQRAEYHKTIKILRSVSPEFRAMWEEETNKAALRRRYT
jgi:hypothetical protein